VCVCHAISDSFLVFLDALREYEMSARRSQDELRAYREAMESREEEYQRTRMQEERRLSEVVDEYR
jgi:hypothetical protein